MEVRLLVVGAAASLVFGLCGHSPAAAVPPKTSAVIEAPASPSPLPSPSEVPSPTSAPSPSPLPDSVLIKTVPYTPQAPTGNWDSAHEEYCEAAAVLMVGRYLRGDTRSVIPPAEADPAMAQIVAWERLTFPGVLDLNLQRVGMTGQQFYGATPVIAAADLDSVKHEIAAGHPVIIPVMTHGAPGGQKIAPNYGRTNVYHVMVLVGYSGSQVYANDAGFTQGQYWKYSWATLESAMDAQQAKMGQGRVMLSWRPQP